MFDVDRFFLSFLMPKPLQVSLQCACIMMLSCSIVLWLNAHIRVQDGTGDIWIKDINGCSVRDRMLTVKRCRKRVRECGVPAVIWRQDFTEYQTCSVPVLEGLPASEIGFVNDFFLARDATRDVPFVCSEVVYDNGVWMPSGLVINSIVVLTALLFIVIFEQKRRLRCVGLPRSLKKLI